MLYIILLIIFFLTFSWFIMRIVAPFIIMIIDILTPISSEKFYFPHSMRDYITGKYVIKKRGGTLIVIDGDTFWSKRYNNKIRIYGIDCPEEGEPGYQEAKDFLYNLLENRLLRIKKKGIDKYGRILAEVFAGGENIAIKMKERGLDKLDKKYKERFIKPKPIDSNNIENYDTEFRCEVCNRQISEEEYYEFNGLCRYCRGGPIQKGFPSPPGFPKI